MALQIPTVTIDDLRQFHEKHFPNAPLPEKYLHGVVAEAPEHSQDGGEFYEGGDEGDGLGFYEDGVKRTLTDEQIALFRHTEIQTILRERRRRIEEGQPLHLDANSPVAAHPVTHKPSASPAPSDDGTPMEISSDDQNGNSTNEVKPKQKWTAISAKTRAKNARSRKKNRANHRARKKAEEREKEKRHLERQRLLEEGQESDEWDAWHQANGPDVVKDETIDLDY